MPRLRLGRAGHCRRMTAVMFHTSDFCFFTVAHSMTLRLELRWRVALSDVRAMLVPDLHIGRQGKQDPGPEKKP